MTAKSSFIAAIQSYQQGDVERAVTWFAKTMKSDDLSDLLVELQGSNTSYTPISPEDDGLEMDMEYTGVSSPVTLKDA
jgi:hypothetical protein